MKQTLQISSAFDQPEFLQDLVERLADRKFTTGFISRHIPIDYKSFESSTIETYVSGTVGIKYQTRSGKEKINMPFTSSFLFTCIRAKEKIYNMKWALSLS